MKKKYKKRFIQNMTADNCFVAPARRTDNFCFKEAYLYQKKLGRLLTKGELQRFIIHKKEKPRYLQKERAKYLVDIRDSDIVNRKESLSKTTYRHICINYRVTGFI